MWQRCALPATPDTLSLYITDLLLRRKKVTTAARIVCGVALAALLLGEIEFCAEGLRIRVRREKQDPAGLRRRIIGVPYGQDLTFCPVGCLHAWLNIRGTESGPLFTRLDPARDHDLQGLSLNGIARVVKAAVARIGLDPTLYGPHSLRAGFITEAGQHNVGPLVIAAQTGHRSLDSLQRYFRPVDAFRVNACAALGL